MDATISSTVAALLPTSTFTDAAAAATATALAIAALPPPINPFRHGYMPEPGMLTNGHGPHDHPPRNECELLGPFALLVQLALGGLALTTLIFKRYRERPQRPLKIWLFDVSKQVVGSILVHVANLLMSMLSAGEFSMSAADVVAGVASADSGVVARNLATLLRRDHDSNGNYMPNPCSFYLLNLAIDTTIGIPILIVLLRIFTALLSATPFGSPPDSLRSGHYGSPPKTTWWFKQCVIYFLGLLGMKLCVLLIFLIIPWISQVGDWALRWTEGNEKLQVFFVMMFFPLIMNATQYYIIDTFIKDKNPHNEDADERERLNVDEDGFDVQDSDSLLSTPSNTDEDLLTKSHNAPISVKKASHRGGKDKHSYDEDLDGESSPTTVVGSADAAALASHNKGKDNDDEA